MPRVKCPHCGAGNQDVTEKETCWQCGLVLGAPVARPAPSETAVKPVIGATQMLDPSQLQRPASSAAPPPPPAVSSSSSRLLVIALTAAIVLIGILVIVLFVLASRS